VTRFVRRHLYSQKVWALVRDLPDTVFAPIFETIIDAFLAVMAAITFITVAALVYFLIQLSAAAENRKLKFALRSLRYANLTIVAGTPKILVTHTDDYLNGHKDKSHCTNVFLDDVL
jgi:hypothetical protein